MSFNGPTVPVATAKSA